MPRTGDQNPIARENGKLGGRPIATKTKIAQLMRQQLAERAFEKADAIFTAWEDMALGHYREVKNPLTGTVRVYFKPGDPSALKDMMEQVWGKPKQPIELLTEEEPEWNFEAVSRMGKYADSNDPEYLNATAKLLALPPAIDLASYQLRRMGDRFTNDPAGASGEVDKDNTAV